ncbi:MAG TPA: Spy/CpxP family protein refolding chaperone [Candidatus Binatia bacterium]|nr:Spy/CpxP family protein refolding chaperone [Candidatus Binatia bacterium]
MSGSTFTRILAAAAFGVAVATGSSALAHGGGPHHSPFRILRGLDLTSDQQQKIHDLVSADRPTLARLRANVRAARKALAAKLLAPGAVTDADLDALAERASDARAALVRERLKLELAVRNVLTPDQLGRAATVHAEMQQLRDQMHQLLRGEPAS